jgi:hypothetical protein
VPKNKLGSGTKSAEEKNIEKNKQKIQYTSEVLVEALFDMPGAETPETILESIDETCSVTAGTFEFSTPFETTVEENVPVTKGSFYSEDTDASVFSSDRQTLLFSSA